MIALLIGAGFSLVFTLLTTPLFIKLFNRIGWGQFIRDDGPQSHHAKRGTPTMGGIVFIIGAVLGYFVGHLVAGVVLGSPSEFTRVAFLVMFLMVGLGAVGFIDDFLKTRNQRSLGLGGWSKILGQVIVASIFAVLAINSEDENGLTAASSRISGVRDIESSAASRASSCSPCG
jgi:phospho-N-acetylmuramoyl-pentapeptide-transferase